MLLNKLKVFEAEIWKDIQGYKDNISSVCKNKRKSCGGYGWKYFEEGDVVNE